MHVETDMYMFYIVEPLLHNEWCIFIFTQLNDELLVNVKMHTNEHTFCIDTSYMMLNALFS